MVKQTFKIGLAILVLLAIIGVFYVISNNLVFALK
jgi:hypothetical protein